MNIIRLKAIALISMVSLLALSLNVAAGAQHTGMAMNSGASKPAAATLTAKLVDPEKKAKEKTATVEVTVKGVALIDPAMVNCTIVLMTDP